MCKVLTTIKDAGYIFGVVILFYALIGLQLVTLLGIERTMQWYKSGGDKVIFSNVEKATDWFQSLTKIK